MYIIILQEERVQHTVLSMALALRRDTSESYLLAIVPYKYLWKKICLLKLYVTAQKMKFSVKDFFSNVTKSAVSLRIWTHLLKKSLVESFNFCTVLQYHFNNLNLNLFTEFNFYESLYWRYQILYAALHHKRRCLKLVLGDVLP